MASFTPTAEQQDIIDAFATGNDLVVVAGAGAGKTATLMLAAEAARGRRGVYIAYNKALADEAKEKFTKAGLDVDCRTAHSLAFREVGVKFKHRLGGGRMSAWEKGARLGLPRVIQVGPEATLDRGQLAGHVTRTVERFMKTIDDDIEAKHIPDLASLDPRNRTAFQQVVIDAARRLWDDLSDPAGTLPFTHDVYLALWARTNPILKADYVMLDESQDASAEIAHVFTSQPFQKVAVGDPNQQLYAWRGARSAIDGMPAGTKELRLTQSFRFGPAVADEANEWLEDLGSDLRIKGTESIHSTILDDRMSLGTADASLHRTNADAIDAAIDAITSGTRVAIAGGTRDIEALAKAAGELQTRGSTSHPQFAGFTSWQQVVEHSESDDGADLKPIVGMITRHTAAGVLKACKRTVDEDDAELVVSTAHKSKGRQWGKVRIGGDFPEPGSKRSTRDEKMLAYVAVTRAQHILDPGSLRREEALEELAMSVEAATPITGEAPERETLTLTGFDFSALEDAVEAATVNTTPATPAPTPPAEPTTPAVDEDVIEVTVRYTGTEAQQLRDVLDQLGYKSPDAFVEEMAKGNAFWLQKVAELGHRRWAA